MEWNGVVLNAWPAAASSTNNHTLPHVEQSESETDRASERVARHGDGRDDRRRIRSM